MTIAVTISLSPLLSLAYCQTLGRGYGTLFLVLQDCVNRLLPMCSYLFLWYWHGRMSEALQHILSMVSSCEALHATMVRIGIDQEPTSLITSAMRLSQGLTEVVGSSQTLVRRYRSHLLSRCDCTRERGPSDAIFMQISPLDSLASHIGKFYISA